MVNVLLYAIVNDNHVIEQWAAHSKRVRFTGFIERFMAKLGDVKAITVCSVKMDGLWVYYFCQETFLFVLVADGLEVPCLCFSGRPACSTTSASSPRYSTRTTTRQDSRLSWTASS